MVAEAAHDWSKLSDLRHYNLATTNAPENILHGHTEADPKRHRSDPCSKQYAAPATQFA